MITGSKRLTSTLLVSLLSFLFVLSGCGGGGGGDEVAPPNQSGGEASSVLGVVVDPYIVDAVLQEINPEGRVLQESTPSDAKGQFAFADPLSDGSLIKMKASAQSRHNNAPYSGILKSRPAGQQPLVVSPLSTLIANGMTAEEVVSLLQGAGLSGFTTKDVFADPMEGTDDLTGIGHLERLQASLAVNAFFALNDNYEMDRSAVADQKAKLAELVQAVRTVVDPEMFQQAESAPQLSTLATGTPRVNFGHFLKAAIAITDAVVAKKRADLDLNAIDEAGLLLGSLPELTLFYYAQENRGIKVIEDQIKDGILPDASPGAVPVIEASGEVVKNTPPVASAGSGKTVQVTEAVQLNAGASSDADGDALSYRWTLVAKPEGSLAALDKPSSLEPIFIADQTGIYEVSLVVNDGNVNSAPSTVIITAVEENGPTPGQELAYEAPVLESVEVNGNSWILNWTTTNGLVPGGGFDIIIDGIDTNETNRTTAFNANIQGLTAGDDHCFQVEARWSQVNPSLHLRSKEMCTGIQDPIPAPSPVNGPLPVFPGAQGFGVDTPAGRGGKIIKVTNLHDSGPGSLRAAIDASGPRTVVFEVAGTINLASNLTINNSNITIAGQSAPSPGITLKNAGIRVNTQHVLIQHLRIRVGDSPSGPNPIDRDGIAIVGASVSHVVIDHVSVSWATDENVSLWFPVKNVTISNSIISEALFRSLHPEGVHSMGLIVGGGASRNISLVSNLFAHNNERNPLINGGTTLVALNNVMYNAGRYEFMGVGGDPAAGATYITAIGNSAINGPNTASTTRAITMSATKNGDGSKLYLSDNRQNGNLYNFSSPWLVDTPPIWSTNLIVRPSNIVDEWVYANAGARPADRDSVDKRVVNEVKTRSGGFVNSPSEVGGWPNLSETFRPFPDLSNPNGDDDGDGYTNVEELLHQMAEEVE